ncbi:hypothetical protein [Paenibacillus mucilaginosus]|uniref:Uncharacterized protein n=1 Tax=Paenibacillus mucilaginosus (strain KNP414) TaxID=1036673 RepID=F8F9R1_PAEMK|nr:hypothetical protein [Paenibacillus mucilaginosus]AEI44390.1 hypothetical protein KNP414_05866 [Paenibacillus mucilaginosus KNP414]MCG7213769.1 hypothetical protein [Paenibacillus mucilaginosus]WDM25781.1 hypothetical protein KCX80_25500 [Paenibacillus mucilaginosus]
MGCTLQERRGCCRGTPLLVVSPRCSGPGTAAGPLHAGADVKQAWTRLVD